MDEQLKKDQQQEKEQDLLESKISEQIVIEHPTYKQLEDKLTKAEQQTQEYWNDLLRIKAEIENIKRRTSRDIENAYKYSLEKFVLEILVIVDNLERSLAVKPVQQQ